MKKVAILLTLTSLLFASQPANAASVTAGAKCVKAGSTSISNGKKFTCVKKSGKLVWNNGVVILKAGICPAVSAADKKEISKVRANTLITMTEPDSLLCAEKLGWGYRVGQRDDETFALTMDYRPDRITVTIKDGLVNAVIVG